MKKWPDDYSDDELVDEAARDVWEGIMESERTRDEVEDSWVADAAEGFGIEDREDDIRDSLDEMF